jgi:hypothetical protein
VTRETGPAIYQIVQSGSGWIVRHDGDPSVEYVTREAAFEAAVSAASRALKEGLGVRIEVEAPAQGSNVN